MSSIIPCYCDECTHLDEDENSVACGACVHIGAGSEDNYVCSTDHVLEIDAKIASAIAAERERCAGAAKEIAESTQTEWVIDTDKAWAAGWKEASAAIEKKIRGEK